MASVLAVTAADDAFFGMLCDLLDSIEVQCTGRPTDIGLFDLGIHPERREQIASRVHKIVAPGWDLNVPDSWRAQMPHLRALTVRPFLPRHFPGYDVYIWIDSDVWLQDWRGIELYTEGARLSDLAITPHTDRSYAFNPAIAEYRHNCFAMAYGKPLAEALSVQHHLNAGVFAARAASPVWSHWAIAYQAAIDASAGRMISDQIALNFACYRHRLSLQLLPAIYNWQCHLAVPARDPHSGLFCEPYLPHSAISMMHLTHKSKDQLFDIRYLDGSIQKMSLRRSHAASPPPTAEPRG